MNSDEEYLDSLLKSIMEEESGDSEQDSIEDSEETEKQESADEFAIQDLEDNETEFAIQDFEEEMSDSEMLDSEMSDSKMLDKEILDTEISDTEISDIEMSDTEMSDIEMSDIKMSDTEISDIEISDIEMSDIGATLPDADNSLEGFAIEDFGEEELPPEEEAEEDIISMDSGSKTLDDINTMSLDEIDQMFAAADAAASGGDTPSAEAAGVEDDDLAEINGLLQSDSDSTMEDDMLALLEKMSEDTEQEGVDSPDIPILSSSGTESEEQAVSDSQDQAKEKKKKGLFGKKKKEESEQSDVSDAADGLSEETAEKTVKAPGFLGRILSFLTEADDEHEPNTGGAAGIGLEPSEENKEILKELNEEDKKKKNKKVKNKKGKNSDEEDKNKDYDEDEEIVLKEKKGKKEKKAKKQVISESIIDNKPAKIISKKNIAIIVGLSVTLGAIIMVLCTVVPGYMDKSSARDSYYKADYSQSYELLYGKKLDESDSLIFNKSRIIMGMKRKLDSYHNYMSLEKEVQALDALMSGIAKYPNIMAEAEEFHVTQEVKAIYDTMLNILNDKFGISEEIAKAIVSYEDDLVYTKKLESIVYGTPFVMPGEESLQASENTTISDILPEEQQMMDQGEAGTAAQPAATTSPEETMPVENTQPAETQQPVQETDAGAGLQTVPAGNQDQSGVTGSETAAEVVPEPVPQQSETQTPSTPSQGEMIQGVNQPLEIKIHGK